MFPLLFGMPWFVFWFSIDPIGIGLLDDSRDMFSVTIFDDLGRLMNGAAEGEGML